MSSSSCEVVFLIGCLSVRLSSCEVVFLLDHLYVKSSSFEIKNFKIQANCYFFGRVGVGGISGWGWWIGGGWQKLWKQS